MARRKREKVEPCVQVRKEHEDLSRFWAPRHRSMTKLERFLGGERYVLDNDTKELDRRLTQIRGQEIQDTIRHVVGESTAQARSVEARAIDRDTDPDQAEVEAALVERELADPWKEYNSLRYEAIQSAREKRLGVVWMDWDPECGTMGEILFTSQDPRRIMWDPAYSPHHPNCRVLFRTRRIDAEKANDIYGVDWIQPDREACCDEYGRLRTGIPLLRGFDGQEVNPLNYDDQKATIWECWYKNDRTTYRRDTPNADPIPMDPEDWYMTCLNNCGYRSPTQGKIAEMAGEAAPQSEPGDEAFVEAYLQNGATLPEQMPGACPDCAEQGMVGDLEKIEAKSEQQDVLQYSRGKRLIIMAPYGNAPDDKPLYDGKWPIPSARSYPAFFVFCYVKPGEPVGPCDTDLMWDQQVAADNLRTLMLQRVFEHRNYWIMDKVGFTDWRNLRFEFREDQYNIIFRDTSIGTNPQIEMKNGTGVDPEAINVFSIINAALTQYRGVADFGLTPENSKDIAGTTVAQLTQQGNIPINDFKKRTAYEESKFYGVVSDYIHATYTPEKIARLHIEGADIAVQLWGQDQPNYDFVVEETPEFSGLEKAKGEAFNALIQAYTQALQLQLDPIATIELFANVNGLPRSVVRQFEKMILAQQQAQMEAQQQMMGGEAPPEDGSGGGAQDVLAQLMQGGGSEDQLNGSGMEPAPAAQ